MPMLPEPSAAAMEELADGSLSVSGAAAFAGLSESRFYELMKSGEIPFFHHGAKRLIPKRAVIRYLAGLYQAEVAQG